MKRLVASILAASLLTSAASALGHDPEHVGTSTTSTAQSQDTVIAASSTAHPAVMTVLLNGMQVKPVGYNINGNNYYKLRDIAQILTGSTAQFGVNWDKNTRTMQLTPGVTYTPVGGELGAIPTKKAIAKPSTEQVQINHTAADLTAYNVDGYNYFKLVDLGNAFGFAVEYEAATRTVVMNTPPAQAPQEEPKPPVSSHPMVDLQPSIETPQQPTEPEKPAKPDVPNEPHFPETSNPPSTPPSNPLALDGKLKIWIDPGHGGSDSGNSATCTIPFDDYWGVHHEGNTKIYEKDFNLAVSLILQQMLEEAGVEVRMTRTDDTTVTPNERQKLFSTEGQTYDMIFSVHHNGYSTSTPQGAEILIQVAYENGGPGREFGEILKSEYDAIGQTWRRFVFARSNSDHSKDYYFVLRAAQKANALAFISEFCFMSNAQDQLWMLSTERLEAQAKAQYNAIMKYFETHPY